MLDEARESGCRLRAGCLELGLETRTVRRWRKSLGRAKTPHRAPRSIPGSKLTEAMLPEQNLISARAEHCSDIQAGIVAEPVVVHSGPVARPPEPREAATESSVYRAVQAAALLTAHRQRPLPEAQAPRTKALARHSPNHGRNWDLAQLPGAIRGTIHFLYNFVGIWGRRIIKGTEAAHPR